MTIHRILVPLVVAGGLALTGCQDVSSNKAGARHTPATTLQLALPDVDDADAAYFVKAAEKHSGGQLKITIDDQYDSADTTKEAKLPAALANGVAHLAYMPARDLAMPELPEFQALAAPFSVTTQAGMQAVAGSGFATHALASLEAVHMIGLGLIPVEPRQLLSTRPLASANDFHGSSLRVVLDPAVAHAVEALGGTAKDVPSSSSVRGLLQDGTLTGAETSPQYALSNGYVEAAPYLTAFGMYAKFDVIAVSQRAWTKLDPVQRSALKAAAADTLAHTRDGAERQTSELAAMCRQDVVVVGVSSTDLNRIVSTAAVDSSAYADAARDLAAVPGAGPATQAVPVPSSCTVADSAAAAVVAHRHQQTQHNTGSQPSETTTIPAGSYVTTTTVADLRRGGQFGPDWNKPITWSWRFADGKVDETQKPDYPDQGPCGGTYQVRRDELTITWTSGSCAGSVEVTRWSFYKGQLSLQNVDVADTAAKVIYAAHPWRKND
jgi:TRAP-type C4-dicarboxylate transport system substrate-binding protein